MGNKGKRQLRGMEGKEVAKNEIEAARVCDIPNPGKKKRERIRGIRIAYKSRKRGECRPRGGKNKTKEGTG